MGGVERWKLFWFRENNISSPFLIVLKIKNIFENFYIFEIKNNLNIQYSFTPETARNLIWML